MSTTFLAFVAGYLVAEFIIFLADRFIPPLWNWLRDRSHAKGGEISATWMDEALPAPKLLEFAAALKGLGEAAGRAKINLNRKDEA